MGSSDPMMDYLLGVFNPYPPPINSLSPIPALCGNFSLKVYIIQSGPCESHSLSLTSYASSLTKSCLVISVIQHSC
jgi:hypothetical protein